MLITSDKSKDSSSNGYSQNHVSSSPKDDSHNKNGFVLPVQNGSVTNLPQVCELRKKNFPPSVSDLLKKKMW